MAEAIPAEEHYQAIQDHVVGLYDQARCVGSFVAEDGQVVDCLAMETQPGVTLDDQRSVLQVVPPPFVTADGEDRHLGDVRDVPPMAVAEESTRDALGNPRICPPGAIPMRRVTVEEITQRGGLRAFQEKAPGVAGIRRKGRGILKVG